MDQLNLHRYCCRRMIMTHVDLIEKLLKFVQPPVHNSRPSANLRNPQDTAPTAGRLRKSACQIRAGCEAP